MENRDKIIIELIKSAYDLYAPIKTDRDACVFGHTVNKLMSVAISKDEKSVCYAGWIKNSSSTWEATRLLNKVCYEYNHKEEKNA